MKPSRKDTAAIYTAARLVLRAPLRELTADLYSPSQLR
jgi:hypothetical protein